MRTSNLRRLPWGLIGMLLLVWGTERYFSAHALDLTRAEFADWHSAGKSSRHKTKGAEVLVFGTSMTQQGLLPSVLRDRIGGGEAYNLSVCAGQAPASYFLLKRALDAGANPRAVLVDFHPQFLAGSYRSATGFWPDLLELREILDLAWTARDPSFFGSMGMATVLPSVKRRSQIRDLIMATFRGETINLRYGVLMFTHNKNQNRGALIYPKKPEYNGEVAPRFAEAFAPGGWALDPINAQYTRRFIELAQSRGIEVYWVIPPLSPQLQSIRDQSGAAEPYHKFIRELQAEYANLAVLDASKSKYTADVFTDAAHLDGEGAMALSAAVGDTLAWRRETPNMAERWIELPKYRRKRLDTPHPDLKDSEVALKTLFSPRR